MRCYRAFGLDIASEIALPGMPAEASRAPDVTLRMARPADEVDARRHRVLDGFFTDASVSEIVCDPSDHALAWKYRLVAEALPRVVALRGGLVIAGSVVASPAGAVLLLGDRAVRQTVVTRMLGLGWTLGSATAVALRMQAGVPHALPGTPHLLVSIGRDREVAPCELGTTLTTFGDDAWVVTHRRENTPRALVGVLRLGENDAASEPWPCLPGALPDDADLLQLLDEQVAQLATDGIGASDVDAALLSLSPRVAA